MFVWFLQKKGFLGLPPCNYLPEQLQKSEQRGPNRFFGEFLNALFFEAFAKPEAQRSRAACELTGIFAASLGVEHVVRANRPVRPIVFRIL